MDNTQNTLPVLFDATRLQSIVSESKNTHSLAIEGAVDVVKKLEATISIEDDDKFMHEASVSDNDANNFLVKCRDAYNYINASRKEFTVKFDELKKIFTEVENSLNAKGGDEIAKVSSLRSAVMNRVAKINSDRKAAADLAYNKEKEQKAFTASLPSFATDYVTSYLSSVKQNFVSGYDSGLDFEVNLSNAITDVTFEDFFSTLPNPQYINADDVLRIADDWYNNGGFDSIVAEVKDRAPALKQELESLCISISEGNAAQSAQQLIAEAKEAEQISKNEAKASFAYQSNMAELTTSNNIPDIAFKGTINTSVDVMVTSQVGYSFLFTEWFKVVGKDMTIEKLAAFKLSSLLVWAKKRYKDTGIKIEAEGVVYFEAAKTQVRKKNEQE